MRRALLAALLLALAPAARAEQAVKPTSVKVGSVTLQIVDNGNGEQELRERTRVLAKDAIINPGLAASFKGTQARVFEMSPGGNACDGWPAVITVDKAGKVAADTTMKEECASFNATADAEGFTFVQQAVPGMEGSVWRFTPERGMRKLGALVFQPQPNSTWSDLDRMLDHPMSLFSCAPFDAAVHKLTGVNYVELALRLHVGSAVEKKDGYLIATGCQAHACDSDEGFIAIDRKRHDVFVAVRSDKDVTVFPKLETWPAPARDELKAWQKRN